MSKRKAVVNEIIYELDIEDVESSSEDEKDLKKSSNGISAKTKSFNKNVTSDDSCVEVVDMVVDSSDDEVIIRSNASNENQVEKKPAKKVKSRPESVKVDSCILTDNGESEDTVKAVVTDDSTEQILTDSVSLNSPVSTASLNAIATCENRTPLISIHFQNKKMASNYKQKIKKFMLNLIRLHEEENLTGSENETDLELDIWPEDLIQQNEEIKEEQDSMFFFDTAPNENESVDVPKYSKADEVLSNVSNKEPVTPLAKKPHICFNCDGAHQLKDCPKPRNSIKIAEKRKAMNANRVGRYHIEDDQKYGHLVPGRISGKLRHALGLKRDELPLFIYRMRLLGYPPGWLEEARICHSGITMFDSTGKAVQELDDEEGEIIEPGSKDIFDIRKIHDFPGFNVPASSRYKEHAHLYNLPPMSEQDSKLYMLQTLAPNAMRAYKRKKLTFFPSGSPLSSALEGQIEMELDDGDETPEFPTVPPLPDEEPPAPPPPPPPPPDVPPPSEDLPPSPPKDISSPISKDILVPPLNPHTSNTQLKSTQSKYKETTEIFHKAKEVTPNKKSDDACAKLPLDKSDDIITIDEEEEGSQSSSGRESPSLADLEEKKKLLLQALTGGAVMTDSQESLHDASSQASEEKDKSSSDSETAKSQPPLSATGCIKSTSYGTLVINTASSYTKLPSEDKFAKNICDVMHFENLPDSTGKYEKITNLLKRVKSEVDRIQES